MRRVMRTGSLGLIVTAISLGVSPGLAQNVEQVKPVFEHIIPNAEGKRMVWVLKSSTVFASRLRRKGILSVPAVAMVRTPARRAN